LNNSAQKHIAVDFFYTGLLLSASHAPGFSCCVTFIVLLVGMFAETDFLDGWLLGFCIAAAAQMAWIFLCSAVLKCVVLCLV
jgi:hypothetical protein